MRDFHRCLGCMAEQAGESVCPICGWSDNAPQESTVFIAPGTILNGHYLIGRVLGYGGFGITYLAFDLNLQYKLAIKEYLPQSIATRAQDGLAVSVYSGEARTQYDYGLGKFLDEARMLAKFNNHPCIVSVHDFFKENETAYLVMDFIEGITLKDLLEQKGGKIPFRTTLEIMMPVMDALREVHNTGMLHRDVSPDNIYITKERQIKLLDFGAARLAMGEQSKSLSIILKPGYAPEEQYRSRGNQGPWTDVYAVAATIYRAITGKTPPESLDRMEEDHLIRPSALGADIPEPQEDALLKALAVRAMDRFNTMAEFQEQLVAGRVQTATDRSAAASIRQPETTYAMPSSSVNERTLYSQRPAVPVDRSSSYADRPISPAKSMPTNRQDSSGSRALRILAIILAFAAVGALGAVTVYSGAWGHIIKLFGPKEKAVEASKAMDEPVEITAIATWNHPTKKVFAKYDVKLKKVVLTQEQKYPSFYVKCGGDFIDYNFLKQLAKANGYWDFEMLRENGTGVVVRCDRSDQRNLHIEKVAGDKRIEETYIFKAGASSTGLTKDDFVVNLEGLTIDPETNIIDIGGDLGSGSISANSSDGKIVEKKGFMKRRHYTCPQSEPLIEIGTFDDDGAIDSINISQIGTNRGLVVGDTYDRMVEVYGSPNFTVTVQNESGERNYYIYRLGKLEIFFTMNWNEDSIGAIDLYYQNHIDY